MRKLDLQRTFRGAGPAAENLENEPRPVDRFATERLFEIALLHRRQGAIHRDEIDRLGLHFGGDRLDLPFAKVGRGPDGGERYGLGPDDVEIDRPREPDRLLAPRLRAPQDLALARRAMREIRTYDASARA